MTSNKLTKLAAMLFIAMFAILIPYNCLTSKDTEEDYYREKVLNMDDAAYEYCCNQIGDHASFKVIWGYYNLHRATCDSVALANVESEY